MAYQFPSPEWLQALKDKLNSDEKYAQIASKWEGEIVFYIEPGGPVKEVMIFFTDLWHGECRDAFMVDNEENPLLFDTLSLYVDSQPGSCRVSSRLEMADCPH